MAIHKTFQCETLLTVFFRRNQNVPMKKMKSGRGRGKSKSYHPYKCPFCAKRFEKPSQLQRHLRVHTGQWLCLFDDIFISNVCGPVKW